MKCRIKRWNPSVSNVVSGTFKGYSGAPDEGIFCALVDDFKCGLTTIPLQDFYLVYQFRKLDPDINEVISINCSVETSADKSVLLRYSLLVHGYCTVTREVDMRSQILSETEYYAKNGRNHSQFDFGMEDDYTQEHNNGRLDIA